MERIQIQIRIRNKKFTDPDPGGLGRTCPLLLIETGVRLMVPPPPSCGSCFMITLPVNPEM